MLTIAIMLFALSLTDLALFLQLTIFFEDSGRSHGRRW